MNPGQHLPIGQAALAEFQECIQRCDDAENLGDVRTAIDHFSQTLGFSHFFLMHLFSPQRIYSETVLIHNHPESWFQCYHRENYYRADPVLAHCQSHTVPLLWQNIAVSPNRRAFVNAARAQGLKYGITFPIHAADEWGLLSFNWQDHHDACGATVNSYRVCGQLFASHVQEAIRRLQSRRRAPAARRELTRREKQCLLWSAEGKTAWETGQILNISERTVVFHLNNAALKLGAANRTQAAVKALPCLSFDIDALQGSAYSDTASVTVVAPDERSVPVTG